MWLSILMTALALPLLMSATAIAGDTVNDITTCVIEMPQKLGRCKDTVDQDQNPAITCSGLTRLAPQTVSKHVRSCEFKFQKPLIEDWLSIRVEIQKAPEHFDWLAPPIIERGPRSPRMPHTQVTVTVESPQADQWKGDEEIIIFYTINGRLATDGK